MAEEQSAIEIILQLPSILKRMESKIDVLDTNLKILNSKLNKIKSQELDKKTLNDSIVASNSIQAVPSAATPSAMPSASPRLEPGQVPKATPGPNYQHDGLPNLKQTPKLVIGGTKVFSTVKTSSGRSVDNMTINIFDESNDLIRNLVTDKDGYWECRLPAGNYSMEMIHPKLKTINKNFTISKDTKNYEVT